MRGMWDEPYLETCCRAALHRLVLAGDAGRPQTEADLPCLRRLTQMGFARADDGARCAVTEAGRARHRQEILRT